MDLVAKQLLQKDAKDADAGPARLQAFVLDTLALLVDIAEETQRGSLTVEKAAESARAAITLLGNASAHISRERQKKAVKCFSSKVHLLAEDEDIFVSAAPLLLGKLFETKMKEYLESLKCLSSQSKTGKNFYKSRPQPSQGGGSFRGRGGSRRFQPYQQGRS